MSPGAIAAGVLLFFSSARAQASPAPDRPRAIALFQEHAAGQQVADPDNRPFLLDHGARTDHAIVMVHGLTDSPWDMRVLGDFFYGRGYNVVGILLPGHGTRQEDLLTADRKKWEAEVQFGLDVAGGLGEDVSVAGLSTGGALTIQAVYANGKSSPPRPLKDIFLFSPGIKINALLPRVACLIPGEPEGWAKKHPWAEPWDPPKEKHRYDKVALKAVCELADLNWENEHAHSEIDRTIESEGIGVFTVASEADVMVSRGAVAGFMARIKDGPRKKLLMYLEALHVAHQDVTRPESNPYFSDMEAAMASFLDGEAAYDAHARADLPARPVKSPTLDFLSGNSDSFKPSQP